MDHNLPLKLNKAVETTLSTLTSRFFDGISCSGSYFFEKLELNLVEERRMESYSEYCVSLEFIFLGEAEYETHGTHFVIHRLDIFAVHPMGQSWPYIDGRANFGGWCLSFVRRFSGIQPRKYFESEINFNASHGRNKINGQADVAVDVYFKKNVELTVYSGLELMYAQLGNRKLTPMKTMLFGIVANCIAKRELLSVKVDRDTGIYAHRN